MKKSDEFSRSAFERLLVDQTYPGTAQLKQAAGAGVRLIHEQPFEGAAGKLVAFLHPKSMRGVLTEFCAIKPGVMRAH